MANRNVLSVADFEVAPRRKSQASDEADVSVSQENGTNSIANRDRAELAVTPSVSMNGPVEAGEGEATRPQQAAKLPRASDDERRDRATRRAIEREDSRNALARLRRGRERESKHFVNVPLNYSTKKRLEKAAHDNDLKMTQIMREAIDNFLTENGY